MAKKVSVLIIMQSMKGGGAEKVLLNLLKGMDYGRFTVTLLLQDAIGVHLQSVPSEVRVLSIRKDDKHWFYRLLQHTETLNRLYLKSRLQRLIGRTGYDIIVSYMEGPAVYIHGLLFNRGKRHVSFVHSDFKNFRWTDIFFASNNQERGYYARMDSIAFVSQTCLASFKEVMEIDSNLCVVKNVVDYKEIEGKANTMPIINNQRFTLMTAGRLMEVKRHDRLIEMAAILRDKGYDFELQILGDGPLKGQLSLQIDQLNLGEYVKLLGFQENPYKYMKSADVILLSSDAEGCPTILSEAICLGKPIVTTRVAGVTELLGDECGIIVDKRAEAFAMEVESILKDKNRLLILSKSILSRKEILHSENAVKQFERVITTA